MESLLLALISGAASFVGTWAAHRVHMQYLRRDIDLAHKRIDKLQERPPCGLKHT